jgi:hypothetical protein
MAPGTLYTKRSMPYVDVSVFGASAVSPEKTACMYVRR